MLTPKSCIVSCWLGAILAAAIGSPAATAAEDKDSKLETSRLEACVRGALAFYNEHSEDALFPMSHEQLARLRKGEISSIRRRVPATRVGDDEIRHHERLTAYILVPQSMKQLWLASLSPELNSSNRLTEHCISFNESGDSRWYQHLDLPWPMQDRHWVIDLKVNSQLCDLAEGAIWERSWRLTEHGSSLAKAAVNRGDVPGLSSESTDDAIYLPLNRGAWIMFRIDEQWTLIAYRVTTSFGGSIPESIVNSMGVALVKDMLNGVAKFAPGMMARHTDGHGIEFSGAGSETPHCVTPCS